MGYRSEVMAFKKVIAGKRFYCFDTETTGLSPVENDIIEFSAICYEEKDGKFTEVSRFDTFINPGYPIPEEITGLTGIDDAKVSDAPKKEEAARLIREYLGEHPILIGYNSVSFDQRFVNSLYGKTINEEFTPAFHLDVLKMTREKLEGPHKLVDVATRLGLQDGVAFHTSIDDADVTFRVFEKILPAYDEAEPELTSAGFRITGITRWKKSETLDRLYVNNTMNWAVYYDIPSSRWFFGRGHEDEIMKLVYSFAGVSDDESLVRKYA